MLCKIYKHKARLFLSLVLMVTFEAVAQGSLPAANGAGLARDCDASFRFCLFETTNMWTFLLLDTATGRVWQNGFSMDETPNFRLPINLASLLPAGESEQNGRFTLYPTQNMFTFMMLDRKDARIWQLQWSFESENRGIVGTIPSSE